MQRSKKQVLTELLVLQAQGGEEEAFRQLYELWANDIYRMARCVLKEVQAAEEVAQDSWVSIGKGLGRLDDAAMFSPWAIRIVRRRCVDWIRRQKVERRARQSLENELGARSDRKGAVSSESAALSEAIHKLDTDSRILIHLFYETGLSVAEAGLALDLPVGTVKSRLHALREKLRREIERTLK